jgi:phenylpropionate dioxygenase-like ring-hydroxylating dioxygenase large terminal subunit
VGGVTELPESKPFPMNAWYAAAWGHELKHELTARRVCDRDLVLYRRNDGQPAVLEDACWHRLLPLSRGRLKGDEVMCGYHGLVFNAEGRCTAMPAQEYVNPLACVRAFPIIERHRLIWVWLGDPVLADPASIPEFHWNDGTAWVGEGGTFYSLNCDYRLVVDNLMDLTHETYVHAGTIGDEAIARTPFGVTHDERKVVVTRWMIDVAPPPFWARQLGRPGTVDRWQIIRFEAPGVVVGNVGVAPAGTGAPAGNRSHGVDGFFLAAITPETATSCHYFWNFVRSFRTDDSRLTTELRLAHVNGGSGVYEQDRDILEAQQQAIARHPGRHLRSLNIDAGGLQARRLIDRMIAAEQASADVAVPAGGIAAK